jgi:hypothetical protein
MGSAASPQEQTIRVVVTSKSDRIERFIVVTSELKISFSSTFDETVVHIVLFSFRPIVKVVA